MIRMTKAPDKSVPEVSAIEQGGANGPDRKPALRAAPATAPKITGKGGKESVANASRGKVSPGKHCDDTDSLTEKTGPLIDARKLIRSTVAGLSDSATRGFMTDKTIDLLRRECPGWDLYALHAEFERWVAGHAERTPTDWQRAFVGWVRRQLRG